MSLHGLYVGSLRCPESKVDRARAGIAKNGALTHCRTRCRLHLGTSLRLYPWEDRLES